MRFLLSVNIIYICVMKITEQIARMEVGETKEFPAERYGYLNSLISSRYNKDGMYFSLKTVGSIVQVTRLQFHPRVKRKKSILSMQKGEVYVQHIKHYRTLHVIVSRINDESTGEWTCSKVNGMVEVKRIL